MTCDTFSYEVFINFLSARFKIPMDKFKKDTYFTELGIDSLALYSLISDIEKEYGIKLNIDDFMKIQTVERVYHFVEIKLKEVSFSDKETISTN